jgi:protease-4
VFNGRQSLPLKLVDHLGSERDAVAWLETAKGVRKDLPVRDWKPRTSRDLNLWTAASLGADLLGLGELAEKLRRAAASAEAASLDGLLAVWHPVSEK